MRCWSAPVLSILASGCIAPLLKQKPLGDDTLTYYTAEGGVMYRAAEGSTYKICVAPPAAGARTVSGKGNGTTKIATGADTSIDLGGGGELDHAVEKLFDQQQGVLFLQFSMYRLCEARLNGFIDGAEYKSLFDRVLQAAESLAAAEAEASKADAEAAKERANEAESRVEEKRLGVP